MNFIKYSILLLLVVLVNSSCKKYVDIPPPTNQLVQQLVFSDDKTATATVAGLYSRLNAFNSSFGNSLGNFLPAFSADEFRYILNAASFDEFAQHSISSSNTNIKSLWDNPYAYIYHANAILEGLNKAPNVSAATKTQLAGEAKFIRAFCYFYLVNYFGDVPLVMNTDFAVNTSLPRSPSAEVYAAVIKDLTEAQAELNINYPSAERTRANKAVATALLARVNLYISEWAKAEAEATKLLTNTTYILLANLNSIFLKNSTEAILQWQTINTSTAGVNTWEGFSIIPATPTSNTGYYAYSNFLSAFEPGDQRRNSWVNPITISGTVHHYPYKYKLRTNTPVLEYSMVMRLAEQYLIRAEARAQQNNLTGAKSDVDEIRKRASLPILPDNLTKEQLLLAIEKERRIELFAEWGHRWLDLRRTGRALTVLSAVKPGIEATDLLYPIPLDATLTNPNLVQNPGYN
jgi:hypothetical protein